MSECLVADSVSKSYGSIVAVSDVSLALRHGEIVALVGDNGAGKSTLMNILSGARRPDSGHVRASGTPVHDLKQAQGLGVGMVYQDLALAPDLSVAQNIFLGRELRRDGLLGRLGVLDRRAMRAAAAGAVTDLGGSITTIDAPVASLSGGQRQVAAVARTMMISRLVLLLDEPTAALGPKQVSIVIRAIKRAAESGLGVMIVSHDVPHMLEVANRIVVLRRGAIVLDRPVGDMQVSTIVSAMVGA